MTASARRNPRPEPLEGALATTDSVTAEIHDASQEIAVVGAVLEESVPHELQEGDIGKAIDRAETLEKKLEQSAKKLEQVSATLEKEVTARKDASAGARDSEGPSGKDTR